MTHDGDDQAVVHNSGTAVSVINAVDVVLYLKDAVDSRSQKVDLPVCDQIRKLELIKLSKNLDQPWRRVSISQRQQD